MFNKLFTFILFLFTTISLTCIQESVSQELGNVSGISNNGVDSRGNSILIDLPLNSSTFELNSKNVQKSNNFLTEASINSIIAVLGAIGGGIIGSVFTYRNLIKLENKKNEIEKKKQDEYNRTIRSMVYFELLQYKKFLSEDVLGNSQSIDPTRSYVIDEKFDEVEQRMSSLSSQYLSISVEKKANIFEGDSLIRVESAYLNFRIFKFEKIKGHGAFKIFQINLLINSIDSALDLFTAKR